VRTLVKRVLADERARFLVVGAFNTILGYLLFVGFELVIGDLVGYLVSLYASYAIAIVVAFFLHRHFTYRVTGSGRPLLDFARFASVYVVALAINTLVLPLLVEVAGWPVLLAQAIVVVFTTVLSYLGHKFFSFRRRGDEPAPSSPK